jgi:hypothetical protein
MNAPCPTCGRHGDPWFLGLLIAICTGMGMILGLGSGWLYWWR